MKQWELQFKLIVYLYNRFLFFLLYVLFIDKPSVPHDLTATEHTEHSISVIWEVPEDNGGSDITGYLLERRESTRSSWNNSMHTSDLYYTVRNLTKDKKYIIRVAAVNEIGQGPFAALDEPVTAKSEFDPPGSPNNPQVKEKITYNLYKHNVLMRLQKVGKLHLVRYRIYSHSSSPAKYDCCKKGFCFEELN